MATRLAKTFFYLGYSDRPMPRALRKILCRGKLHKAWFCGHLSQYGIGVVERTETKKLIEFEKYSNRTGIVDKKNGRYAFMNGEPESNNPYLVGELGYAFWLEGYIHAASVIKQTRLR